MFKTKLTQEDTQNLLQWLREGVGYTECSRRLGGKVSKQRVKQIAQFHKIDATAIKTKKDWDSKNDKMVARWGDKWHDAAWRRSEIYKAMREKYRAKKANAVRIGIEFTVPFGELMFPTHCPVLGIELDYFSDGRQENSASFDKIDPNKGYVSGNVAIMSWRANRIKNDGTVDEHLRIAAWMQEKS